MGSDWKVLLKKMRDLMMKRGFDCSRLFFEEFQHCFHRYSESHT